MNLIFFDMEGPLSIHGNVHELMNLFPDGDQVFEVVSRYDDLLALEGKDDYEPGNTLALIIPFLIHHGITEEDIRGLADRADIVPGARELIMSLKHWQVYCISTSYEQYANRIMQRVGIAPENLACTRFPLTRYYSLIREEDRVIVQDIEREIMSLKDRDDEVIKICLDRFFRKELPRTSFGLAHHEIKPMGGRRKAAALRRFARAHRQFPEQVVVVGDSITDARMLETVDRAGGLAIAFNANEYSLPYATVGLASTNISDVRILLNAWEKGGRTAVEQAIAAQGDKEKVPLFHWLEGVNDLEEPLNIHRRIRWLVQQEAGKAG